MNNGLCIYVGTDRLITALQDYNSFTDNQVANMMLSTVELDVRIMLTTSDEAVARNFTLARLRQYHDMGAVPIGNTMPKPTRTAVKILSSDGREFASMRRCAECYGVPLARVHRALTTNGFLGDGIRIRRTDQTW